MTPTEAAARPRVEGDRELEILEATLDVLVEVGYDRLTLDAVATRAKASKATLYRRWNGKAALVVDALAHDKGPHAEPDTGSLRTDLQEAYCGMGGIANPRQTAIFGSIVTAITTDPEFAEAFRREVVGPKVEATRRLWERARDRGEISADADLALLEPALAGILMHRVHVMGEPVDPETVVRVIDQIILPAATRPAGTTATPDTSGTPATPEKDLS